MAESLTGNHFSGVGGVTPSYPVRPVDPSNKDRPSSGERHRKPSGPGGADDDEDVRKPVRRPSQDNDHGTIDEYI